MKIVVFSALVSSLVVCQTQIQHVEPKGKTASLETFSRLLAAFRESAAFNQFLAGGRAGHVGAGRPVLQHENMFRVHRRTKDSFPLLSGAGEDIVADRVQNRIRRIQDLAENKEIENVLLMCEFVLHLREAGNSQQIDFNSFFFSLNRAEETLSRRFNEKLDHEDDLVQRVIWTKENMTLCSQGDHGCEVVEDDEQSLSAETVNRNISNLNLAVREDGSVDWDETLASNRSRFSGTFWDSLRGKEHEEARVQNESETTEVQHLRKIADSYEEAVNELKNKEEKIQEQELKEDYLGESSSDSSAKVRLSQYQVDEGKKLAALSRLNLDMQLICEYLERQLLETGVDLPDLRPLVAEADDIEDSLKKVMQPITEALQQFKTPEDVKTYLVDENKLQLISSRVDDLKSRLGIKGFSLAIDWGTTGELVNQLRTKINEGIASGSMVLRILWSDLTCSLKLISRAAFGYKLKRFQVTTVRRFFKDVLVLVPNIIIMIIPLSPVGHVLIFSFIKEKVPWLLPSCLSEKRLKLQRLLEDVKDGKSKMLVPREGSSWRKFWRIHVWGSVIRFLDLLRSQAQKLMESPPTGKQLHISRKARPSPVSHKIEEQFRAERNASASQVQNLAESQQD